MPNECWQSDFTHYRLTDPRRPDRHRDHQLARRLHPLRPARLSPPPGHRRRSCSPPSAKPQASTASRLHPDRQRHGLHRPALPAAAADATPSRPELRRLAVVQKNSRPNHPTTCGKVERFQQTLKKWLRAQPVQPTTIAELQPSSTSSSRPTTTAVHTARCRTGPPQQPLYETLPKATPGRQPRPRHPRPDPPRPGRQDRHVTLRVHGQLRHIGIGRTHAGTHVILLVQDLDVRVVNATTGELLRELTIDPDPRLPTHRPGHPK